MILKEGKTHSGHGILFYLDWFPHVDNLRVSLKNYARSMDLEKVCFVVLRNLQKLLEVKTQYFDQYQARKNSMQMQTH